MSDDWDWQFTDSAKQQFDSLDDYAQERITSKLDEIIAGKRRDHQNPHCFVDRTPSIW
jgi:mRNA interferase RelE/StbE